MRYTTSYFLFGLLVLFGQDSIAQRFGWSLDCHVNVNDTAFNNETRRLSIRSTVKMFIQGEGFGTGLLINRNISEERLGFYILTVWHNINSANFDGEHVLYFNYQSPGDDNEDTPVSNRALQPRQTNLIDVFDGHEYRHPTRLRLVASYAWGDMALLEVLDPIPPHFNLAYAGWDASRFRSVGSSPLLSNPGSTTPYAMVHHPRGDIKKISGTGTIIWAETAIATGCYTVTTLIDLLFGWAWGNRVSTQVICNYVDYPWLHIPAFGYGLVEPGSSGASLFNNNHRTIAVHSSGLGNCDIHVLKFCGKLHSTYPAQALKNALNPAHNPWIDILGMPSREISCHESLVLPGRNERTVYFPANHYQAENKIILQARTRITTNAPIVIASGADYELIAGELIELNDGFETMDSVEFTASIAPCDALRPVSPELLVLDKLREQHLPSSSLHQVRGQAQRGQNRDLQLYPNPATHQVRLVLPQGLSGKLDLDWYNSLGQVLRSDYLEVNVEGVDLSLEGLMPGLYHLHLRQGQATWIGRLTVQ